MTWKSHIAIIPRMVFDIHGLFPCRDSWAIVLYCTLQSHRLGHLSVWPLTFSAWKTVQGGETLRPLFPRRLPARWSGPLSCCKCWSALPSFNVELGNSDVILQSQPCCHCMKAAPFDFDLTALSFVQWRWPQSVHRRCASTGRWHL